MCTVHNYTKVYIVHSDLRHMITVCSHVLQHQVWLSLATVVRELVRDDLLYSHGVGKKLPTSIC